MVRIVTRRDRFNRNQSSCTRYKIVTTSVLFLTFLFSLNVYYWKHIRPLSSSKSIAPRGSGAFANQVRKEFRAETEPRIAIADPVVVQTNTMPKSETKPPAAVATSVVVGTTKTSKGVCAPFNEGSSFQNLATKKYRGSSVLPLWMIEYFDWHREQTAAMNECNIGNYKFLILRCSNHEEKCGGLSDRLRSLPLFIAAAASSKRVFLIRWERPTKLEEFLVPKEINWSVPDWLQPKIHEPGAMSYVSSGKRLQLVSTKFKDKPFVEGYVMDSYGASSVYHYFDCQLDKLKTYDEDEVKKSRGKAGSEDYLRIFRHMWQALFEPSPPVGKLIADHMESSNLVRGKFSTAQYRAFYGTEHNKEKPEDELKIKAENALNCASKLEPGDPIYFASDSHFAVRVASNMGRTTSRKIVTFDDEKEALHLDKKDQWTSGNVADFYPVFVDLLVMAEARCMAHGVGGYGTFANMLSVDPTCVIEHDVGLMNTRRCNWTDK